MAINIKTVTCPACGAKVNYDENNKIARCEFCGAVLDMTEQYGEKKDRERDDMQDEQLRTIMNRMHVRNTGNNDPNIRKAKRTALIIVICLVVFGFMSTIIFSTVGAMRFSNAIKEETTKVIDTDINPFDKLTIKYTGVSGNAVGRLDDKNIHGISTLKKTTSDLEKLSNGDTITVKYPQDSYKDGNTIYHFTETEKTYTVRGLDEYVTDINEIGEEDLAALKKNAIDKAIFECKDDNFPYVEDSFEIYAIYTMVKKDFTKQTSVFIVSFDYTDDKSKETKTGYFMAEYSNITKLGDGSFKINFNAGGFNYSRESYLGGFTVISAHSTWDAVYTDVYLNNKAEWSIHEDYMKYLEIPNDEKTSSLRYDISMAEIKNIKLDTSYDDIVAVLGEPHDVYGSGFIGNMYILDDGSKIVIYFSEGWKLGGVTRIDQIFKDGSFEILLQ